MENFVILALLPVSIPYFSSNFYSFLPSPFQPVYFPFLFSFLISSFFPLFFSFIGHLFLFIIFPFIFFVYPPIVFFLFDHLVFNASLSPWNSFIRDNVLRNTCQHFIHCYLAVPFMCSAQSRPPICPHSAATLYSYLDSAP